MKYEWEMRDGLESEIDEVVRQRVSFSCNLDLLAKGPPAGEGEGRRRGSPVIDN